MATPKKVVTPKPVKEKAVKPAKSTVKLVSFSVQATIPTQQYGNIMPRIEVVADSIEEARATVMPIIEELYNTYGEKPRDGGRVSFQRAVITETVKEVAPVAPKPAPVAPAAPQAQDTPAPVAQDVPAPVATAQAPVAPAAAAQKPEPVLKAEKAISLAMTAEAATKIRDQIVASTKIAEEDKPALLELAEAKITDLESNVW